MYFLLKAKKAIFFIIILWFFWSLLLAALTNWLWGLNCYSFDQNSQSYKTFFSFFRVRLGHQWFFSIYSECTTLIAKNGKNFVSEEKSFIGSARWEFWQYFFRFCKSVNPCILCKTIFKYGYNILIKRKIVEVCCLKMKSLSLN